jgi:hypothetical protein
MQRISFFLLIAQAPLQMRPSHQLPTLQSFSSSPSVDKPKKISLSSTDKENTEDKTLLVLENEWYNFYMKSLTCLYLNSLSSMTSVQKMNRVSSLYRKSQKRGWECLESNCERLALRSIREVETESLCFTTRT